MFKLNEKYEVDQKILKCNFIRHSPNDIGTINTPKTQLYINTSREDSVLILLNSFLGLYFDV